MDAKTIFTKTAKGVTQVNQKTQSLSRLPSKILKAIDGKSNLSALSDKLDVSLPSLEKELGQLVKDGFIKIFEVRVEAPISEFGGDDDDFDFTAPAKMASASASGAAPVLKPSSPPIDAFGPSKYRSGVDDKVERASKAPLIQDEAVLIAEQIAARKLLEAEQAVIAAKQVEDARIATEALAAARASAQKAQAEARQRAEREAEIRARLEVEARARKEAEAIAVAENKRAEIAAAQSRAAFEQKLAEESRKREQLLATRERLTQEQQAKEVIAQRDLAEARAKAEAEAKLLAAARAKMELEMIALAEARAQADAAAKRQEIELASAQRALRTQLKAEIEANVRAEMEVLLKSDIKESARVEVEAAIREEALDDARRQLEEQLGNERVSLAKIEADATARAEIAAKKMLAEQETKMRTEMEARLAEMTKEKNRVEIEARKMVEAQAAEAARLSAEFAERLKAEEEARHALEAEALLRRQEAEDNRVQQEATAVIELAARAKADAERTKAEAARVEADAVARANAEAERATVDAIRDKAEAETFAAARAAQNETARLTARLKAEEDTRKQIEADAAQRRDTELLNRARQEKRASEEAEARRISDAEMQAKLTQEKQARVAAQAKALLEADMREKEQRQSSAKLDLANKARIEAEEKARLETKAREIASLAVAQQVAEKEKITEYADQQLAVEREARERAEAKAYADERAVESQRQAQVARLKELAEQAERNRLQPEIVDGKRRRIVPKKEFHPARWVFAGVVLLMAGALVALHVVPLGAVNARLEKSLSEWMHDDVSSSGLRVSLFPKPHVALDQVSVGKLLDAKAGSGKIYMDITAIFGDKFVIDRLELNDVTIAADALPRAIKWASAQNRGSGIEIDNIVLKNVKIDVRGIAIDPFDGDIAFNKKGEIIRGSARTRDGKWILDVTPDKTTAPVEGQSPPWVIDFAARQWTPPVGVDVQLASLTAKGIWQGDNIIFNGIEAKLLQGAGMGNLSVELRKSSGGSASIAVKSEFSLERIKADELLGVFTRDISLTGRTEASFTVNAAASSVGGLLENPTITGSFAIRNGTLSNVDLVQAMRNPGSVGGQTKFAELNGKVRVTDGVVRFDALRLAGGVLFANGSISANTKTSAVAGNVNAEIRSNVAQDRAVFSLSGTVARPALKRG